MLILIILQRGKAPGRALFPAEDAPGDRTIIMTRRQRDCQWTASAHNGLRR